MEQIGSILSGRQPAKQPREITVIKNFVKNEFDEHCQVILSKHSITVVVANGALASELQLRIDELYELCGTEKKLYVRIGTFSS